MKKLAILAAFLAISACTTDKPINLPDGTQGHLIQCNGAAQSIADCQMLAGQICPRGYNVVSKDGEASTVGFLSGNSGFIGPMARRSMMVSCK